MNTEIDRKQKGTLKNQVLVIIDIQNVITKKIRNHRQSQHSQ